MDFYEEVARKLIGIEVELSKKAKGFPVGYTTGKARIKRYLLKQRFNVTSNFQLESIKDALLELGYCLVELDYSSDLFLLNIKNFTMNTRVIGNEEIDSFEKTAVETSRQFLTARKAQEQKVQNETAQNT